MFLVVNFWMKIIRCYYHPILDVSCRQFLDENYMLLLSSNIGCFLSSVLGLDNFKYILPPFCLSSHLKQTHIALFGYISVVYPLCLIIMNRERERERYHDLITDSELNTV